MRFALTIVSETATHQQTTTAIYHTISECHCKWAVLRNAAQLSDRATYIHAYRILTGNFTNMTKLLETWHTYTLFALVGKLANMKNCSLRRKLKYMKIIGLLKNVSRTVRFIAFIKVFSPIWGQHFLHTIIFWRCDTRLLVYFWQLFFFFTWSQSKCHKWLAYSQFTSW